LLSDKNRIKQVALDTITTLSENDQNHLSLSKLGVITDLVKMLQILSSNELSRKINITLILTNFSKYYEDIQMSLTKDSALNALVPNLSSLDSNLVVQTLKALINIAQAYDAKKPVYDFTEKKLPELFNSSNVDILQNSALLLASLTEDATLRDGVDIIQVNLEKLVQHDNEQVGDAALRLVSNLAISNKNRKFMREHSAIIKMLEKVGNVNTIDSPRGKKARAAIHSVSFPYGVNFNDVEKAHKGPANSNNNEQLNNKNELIAANQQKIRPKAGTLSQSLMNKSPSLFGDDMEDQLNRRSTAGIEKTKLKDKGPEKKTTLRRF